MTAPTAQDPQQTRRTSAEFQGSRGQVARWLTVSGLITIVIAIVLGITVSPVLFALLLVAISDLAVAWFFSRSAGARPAASTDAAAAVEADPTYNPYARED